MPKRRYSLSVHALVDPSLRRGDIDDRIYNSDTMSEGTRLHLWYQAKQTPSYQSEVALSHLFEFPDADILLEGRADGIVPGGTPLIDEIKSTVAPLEEFWAAQEEWHLGQAKCYAYMHLLDVGGDKAQIRLTYISQRSADILYKEYAFTREELERDVIALLTAFLNGKKEEIERKKGRDLSLSSLPFPFPSYRLGQREMAKYVYHAAQKGGYIFIEAPTGIGKSLSALYPALKALGKGDIDRLFYLTAKTSGKESALQALKQLEGKGLSLRSVCLASKESLCLSEKRECNPDSCPFARGYYDKLREVLKEAWSHNSHVDPLKARSIAWEKELCPFELLLDLSLGADLIVTDYNHFVDPFAKLERFFGEEADPSKHFLLVDEAHNLPERARSSYSESLDINALSEAVKSLKGYPKRGYARDMRKLMNAIVEVGTEDSSARLIEALPEAFLAALTALSERRNKDLRAKTPLPSLPPSAKEVLRKAYCLLRLHDDYSQNLRPFYRPLGAENAEVGLLCLDPSPYLSPDFSRVKGAAFYSATLSPVSQYGERILGQAEVPYLLLASPFPKENRRLLIAPYVSLRYKDREASLPLVVSYLEAFLSSRKKGNFFVYFPSFSYLRKIKDAIKLPKKARLYVQREKMDDKEKTAFLAPFKRVPKTLHVAYLVLGGSFAEGIDLPGEFLEGVALVGIGLPQVNFENEALREEADRAGKDGFAVAYMNQGIVRSMQAIGRLIRTERDRGMALLIEDRFLQGEYRRLLGRLYPDYRVITSPAEIKKEAASFWGDDKGL